MVPVKIALTQRQGSIFFLQWKDNHKVGYFLEKRLYKIVMLIFNFRLPAFELVSKGAVIGLLVQ